MMAQAATSAPATKSKPHSDLVGRVRRFGPKGVPYEVLEVVSADEVMIRVITTGESTRYPIKDILADPED